MRAGLWKRSSRRRKRFCRKNIHSDPGQQDQVSAAEIRFPCEPLLWGHGLALPPDPLPWPGHRETHRRISPNYLLTQMSCHLSSALSRVQYARGLHLV